MWEDRFAMCFPILHAVYFIHISQHLNIAHQSVWAKYWTKPCSCSERENKKRGVIINGVFQDMCHSLRVGFLFSVPETSHIRQVKLGEQ